MKFITTYLLVILCIFGIYSQSRGQALIDQKLAIISNSAQNGGLFVIEYQVKRTGNGLSRTLATLNADIVFDTCLLKYEFASNWHTGLSTDSGYSKSVSEKFMPHWHSKMLRIFLTAPGVCSTPGNGLSGFAIDSSYAGIVRITFTIINASKPFYLFINNITNQAGIFRNPQNVPSTFEIDNIALSDPVIIIENPLPVTLSSFTYRINGRDVTLDWTTSDEINNKGFEIQRKNSDSPEWKYLGFVKGAGTVQGQTKYRFEDRKPESGQYKYRLKQTDYNGNFTYCELNGSVTIGYPKKFNLSQNYPNPFNPATKIDYDLPADSRVRLVVYDILGRELKVLVSEFRKAGSYTADYNTDGLSSGFYFYTLTAVSDGNEFTLTKKMTVLK
ncbi:MAG: T9SS type A sorting domain-containing protein [Ignavibacteria bacterium]|nr:T9SS type A sorting domain-containing protein [Ignavibacteria bacterium]